MKTIFFVLLSLSVIASHAATPKSKKVTMACRALDKDKSGLFENLKIEMVKPGAEDKIEGAWESEGVDFIWQDEDGDGKKVDEKETVMMNLAVFGKTLGLAGDFSLGEDFGSTNASLFYDYDSEEMILMLEIFSDGPNTKELYRCK